MTLNRSSIRTFVAIGLPQDLRTALQDLEGRLRPAGRWVKWVEPENIHLTLKFLGDTPVEKVDDVITSLREAVSGITSFDLRVDGLGAFPNLNRIQVVWVGLAGQTDVLIKLQNQVEFQMALLDFPEENRDFTPHLTLGRVREKPPQPEMEKLADLLRNLPDGFAGSFPVNSISLIKSQLSPKGAIYSIIQNIELEKIRN